MSRIRYIPTHYGGVVYRGKDQIGLIQKINNEPNYKFFSARNRGYTWEELDDISEMVYEANQ